MGDMNAKVHGKGRIDRFPWVVLLATVVLVGGCSSVDATTGHRAPSRQTAAASGALEALPAANPRPTSPRLLHVSDRTAMSRAVPAPPNDDFANALRLSNETNWLTPAMGAASLEPGEVTGCNLDGRMDRSVWYSLDVGAWSTLQVLMGGREEAVTTAVYGPFRRLPASVGAVGRPLYCVYGTGPSKALTEKVAAGLYLFQLTTISFEEVAPTDLIRHWSTPVPPPVPLIHLVMPGDTLWAIARGAGVPLRTILDANPGIDDPRLIHPGDQIAVPRCAVPVVAPTGWWTGDQTTIDRAGDNDARLVDEATYGRGLVASAFVLDGDGDYVTVADDPTLEVSGDFTVSLWVRFDDTTGEQVLVEKWVQHLDGTPSTGWTLTKLPSDQYRLEIAGGSRIDTIAFGLVPGAWYHVAARLDDTEMTVFFNGTSVATGKTDSSFRGDLSSTSGLKLGHRGNPSDTPGSQDTRQFYLHGAIDEVQLWVGTALSDGDIRSIAAAGSAGVCRR